jgi:hypothetical protein
MMTSLINVLDSIELHEKREQFRKYLEKNQLGEISLLEKAYFQILYDIYFISAFENEDAYPEYKMTNIESVSIEYDKNIKLRYFKVNFKNCGSLEIGVNKLINI